MTLFWLGAACGVVATLIVIAVYSFGICWWLTKDEEP